MFPRKGKSPERQDSLDFPKPPRNWQGGARWVGTPDDGPPRTLLAHAKDVVCNEYNGVLFFNVKFGNGYTINFLPELFSNDSPSVANHPPQPQYVPYSREICGNDSHYSYDCPPQVQSVYNQDLCFNQNFDYFPQTSPSFPQQYLCCENCGGPHETFQCQPMNEDYYHEQNFCYDSNSFGFDQVQPPQYTVNHQIVSSQNDLLNSQNKLMEQMATLREMVDQAIQKKEEEKRIAEEQAARDRSWKIPVCYDDDEDNTIANTPVLPIKEPDNSLSMGDEHLDTIPETESDEFIKSSVEDLIVVNSDDDNSSSDDDSYENIDYVDASPPDDEIVGLEVFSSMPRIDFNHEKFADELAHIILHRSMICVVVMRFASAIPVLVFICPGTDNQEKDEKQRQNDKTGLGMEKTVKDKAKSKPRSQLVKVKVNPSQPRGQSQRNISLGAEIAKP
ncbi:hypothetical protein Tco_0339256 [Tanacetum coccineum]